LMGEFVEWHDDNCWVDEMGIADFVYPIFRNTFAEILTDGSLLLPAVIAFLKGRKI